LGQYFGAKKLQSQNKTREKLRKAFLYEKFAHKMLMKLTAGRPQILCVINIADNMNENSSDIVW
jgi:hypothetical protein